MVHRTARRSRKMGPEVDTEGLTTKGPVISDRRITRDTGGDGEGPEHGPGGPRNTVTKGTVAQTEVVDSGGRRVGGGVCRVHPRLVGVLRTTPSDLSSRSETSLPWSGEGHNERRSGSSWLLVNFIVWSTSPTRKSSTDLYRGTGRRSRRKGSPETLDR